MTQTALSINLHEIIWPNGRHKGERLVHIPVSYLKWTANQPDHKMREIALAELQRRGTVTPEIEVSGHAIDRASLLLRRRWHETALDDQEGLHAWLVRKATEAWNQHKQEVVVMDGMKFVFEIGALWPCLKTLMPR